MFIHYDTPTLWLTAGAVVFLLASGFVVVRRLRTGPPLSRLGVALAAAPSLVFVALFYSLALHMRWNLGRWPASDDERGFSLALKNHATLAICYAPVLWGVTVFIWSSAFILSQLNPRWRRFTAYLAVHPWSCVLGYGLVQLAPAPFLHWWWD